MVNRGGPSFSNGSSARGGKTPIQLSAALPARLPTPPALFLVECFYKIYTMRLIPRGFFRGYTYDYARFAKATEKLRSARRRETHGFYARKRIVLVDYARYIYI